MSIEKDWHPSLEDFLFRIVSRLIYFLEEASLFDAKVSVGPDERIDGRLQEDGNCEEFR